MNEECEVHVREAMLADRRQSGFVNALRVHKSLTAEVEKRAISVDGRARHRKLSVRTI